MKIIQSAYQKCELEIDKRVPHSLQQAYGAQTGIVSVSL